jgi:hypothetical protein
LTAKNKIADPNQMTAHEVKIHRNPFGYSGFWINQTKTYGRNRVKKPMPISVSHEALRFVCSVSFSVTIERLSEVPNVRNVVETGTVNFLFQQADSCPLQQILPKGAFQGSGAARPMSTRLGEVDVIRFDIRQSLAEVPQPRVSTQRAGHVCQRVDRSYTRLPSRPAFE